MCYLDTLRGKEFPNGLRRTSKKSLNFDPQPMNNGSSLTSSIPHKNGKSENILSEKLSPLPLVVSYSASGNGCE